MVEIPVEGFSNQVSLFQIQDFNGDRIGSYLRSIPPGGVVLFSEYAVDPFFFQLACMDRRTALTEGTRRISLLRHYSAKYNHVVVVPFVRCNGKTFYKSIAVIHGDVMHSYSQQRLISYPHWDEKSFFGNRFGSIRDPFCFSVGGARFGVMFGFEAHFDEIWVRLKRKCVDVVLVPTASAFESKPRWRDLLRVHAFTNSCYVIRANKVGRLVSDDNVIWDFYGDSFFCLGDRIMDSLDDRDGVLLVDISLDVVRGLAGEWGFRDPAS